MRSELKSRMRALEYRNRILSMKVRAFLGKKEEKIKENIEEVYKLNEGKKETEKAAGTRCFELQEDCGRKVA